MSMIFEDETAETEAERTRDFSGISSQDPQAESERAFEIEVGQQAAGMRIDSYLTEEIEDAARSYIQRLIEEGRIAVQGRPKTSIMYSDASRRPISLIRSARSSGGWPPKRRTSVLGA